MNHPGGSELRLHDHPRFRSATLEDEMLAYAAEHFYAVAEDDRRYTYLPILEDDLPRQDVAK